MWEVKFGSKLPNTDWCSNTGTARVMRGKGKYETNVSYTDLCSITGAACDMHVKESLEVNFQILDWCNNTGTARVMRGKGNYEGWEDAKAVQIIDSDTAIGSMTQYFGEFYMTDAKGLILDKYREVNQLLRQAYWANGRDDRTMYRAIEHSQNFAVFETESDRLVGFARVVTDYATVFYLCDVYVAEAFRGRGIGKKMVEWIAVYEDKFAAINGLLNTRDTKELYEQFGFVESEASCMVLNRD